MGKSTQIPLEKKFMRNSQTNPSSHSLTKRNENNFHLFSLHQENISEAKHFKRNVNMYPKNSSEWKIFFGWEIFAFALKFN